MKKINYLIRDIDPLIDNVIRKEAQKRKLSLNAFLKKELEEKFSWKENEVWNKIQTIIKKKQEKIPKNHLEKSLKELDEWGFEK
jgi:hypothetical protein